MRHPCAPGFSKQSATAGSLRPSLFEKLRLPPLGHEAGAVCEHLVQQNVLEWCDRDGTALGGDTWLGGFGPFGVPIISGERFLQRPLQPTLSEIERAGLEAAKRA